MKLRYACAFTVIAFFLPSCGIDPQEQLRVAFENADRVEMLMIINGESVSGIKFNYQNQEEILELQKSIDKFNVDAEPCNEKMGILNFWTEDELVLEMSFNASENCSQVWINEGLKDHVFELSDSLSLLINSRFEMVKSIKGS